MVKKNKTIYEKTYKATIIPDDMQFEITQMEMVEAKLRHAALEDDENKKEGPE